MGRGAVQARFQQKYAGCVYDFCTMRNDRCRGTIIHFDKILRPTVGADYVVYQSRAVIPRRRTIMHIDEILRPSVGADDAH